MKPKPPLLLKSLSIEQMRCISTASVDFMAGATPRSRTVIVGANGAGKTTLLRALALSLVHVTGATSLMNKLPGELVRRNKKGHKATAAVIRLELFDPDAVDAVYVVTTKVAEDESGREVLVQETTPQVFPWERVLVAGFGVNRGGRRYAELSQYDTSRALESLFSDDSPLLDPEGVLKSLALEKALNHGKGARLDQVLRVLRGLLRLNPNHKFDIDHKGVRVHGPWGAQPFHALGDGYRSTAGWVLDFIGHVLAADRQGDKGPAGIVLIDEVDEHLHPAWQRELLPLLSKHLPEVQLVATTHSPVTVVPTEAHELVLVSLHNAVANVSQDLPDTTAKSIDAILRGQWFGLEEVMDDETERLLADYRRALRDGPQDGEAFRSLRHEVRQRAPSALGTPLEEMAVQVVEELRNAKRAAPSGAGPTRLSAVDALRDEPDTAGLLKAAADKLRASLRSEP